MTLQDGKDSLDTSRSGYRTGQEYLYKTFLLLENKKVKLIKVKQIWGYIWKSLEILSVMGNYLLDVGFQSYLVGPHLAALQYISYVTQQ